MTGVTRKDAPGPGARRKQQYSSYYSPSGSYRRSNSAVTAQEALVRAEIVKVMFTLPLNMHLLSAEGSPRTQRGDAHLTGRGCKELARVGAGGRAALETSPAPGPKSTLCVSVTEPSLKNTWFGVCSPITAKLLTFEKDLHALYSFFCSFKAPELPEECQSRISRTDLYLSYQVC